MKERGAGLWGGVAESQIETPVPGPFWGRCERVGGRVAPCASEWIIQDARIRVGECKPPALQFKPVKFDADDWVSPATEGAQALPVKNRQAS